MRARRGGLLEVKHLPPAVTLAVPDGLPLSIEPSPLRLPSSPPPDELLRMAPGACAVAIEDNGGFERGAPTEAKLRELLVRWGGNVAAVARALGKGRMQVHRWMRRYGLEADEYRPR